MKAYTFSLPKTGEASRATNIKTVITPQGDVLMFNADHWEVTKLPPIPPLTDEERQEMKARGIVSDFRIIDEPLKASATIRPLREGDQS